MELPLDLVLQVADMAAAGDTPMAAFVVVQNRMKNTKRADFEAHYAQLVGSGFLRNMERRSAREQDFKNKLKEAVLATEPPEQSVMLAASLLAAAVNDPRQVPACLAFMKEYLIDAIYGELMAAFELLWPRGEPA